MRGLRWRAGISLKAIIPRLVNAPSRWAERRRTANALSCSVRGLRARPLDKPNLYSFQQKGEKTMPHPLVSQLRFTRAEFQRGLEGLTDAEACRRFMPMNCISWNIGH